MSMALYESGKTKICIICSIKQQIGGINVIHRFRKLQIRNNIYLQKYYNWILNLTFVTASHFRKRQQGCQKEDL